MNTLGVTVTDNQGREFQAWVTTDKDPYTLVNDIRKEYDND